MKGSLVFKFIVLMLLIGSTSVFAQVYCVTYGNPIPSNQVITGVFNSAQCPYGGGWAYRVQPPSAYLNVCNQSWATANRLGWVTVPSASTLTSCLPPGTIGLTYGTRPIRQPSSNIWICDSTIPSGFRVTQTISDTQCSLDKQFNATRYYIVSNSPSSSSSSSSSSRSSVAPTGPLPAYPLPSHTSIKFTQWGKCVQPSVEVGDAPEGTSLVASDGCDDSRFLFSFNYTQSNVPTVIKAWAHGGKCWIPEGDSFNPVNTAKIVLSSNCVSEGAQFILSGSIIKHVKSGKCVTLQFPYQRNLNPLILTDACSFNSHWEATNYFVQPTAVTGHLYVHENSGSCLRPLNPGVFRKPSGEPIVFYRRSADGTSCNTETTGYRLIAHYYHQYGTGWGGLVQVSDVSTGQCVSADSVVDGAALSLSTQNCVMFENTSSHRMLRTANGLCIKAASGSSFPANQERAVLSSNCSNGSFWRQSPGASQYTW